MDFFFYFCLAKSYISTIELFGDENGSGGSLDGSTLLDHNLVCNAIKIPLALWGEGTATIWVLLDQTDSLQRLQSLAGTAVSGLAEVRWVHAVTPAATVDFGDGTNTGWATVVQVTQNRSAPSVVPVWILWRQLLEFGGLDNVHLFWDLQFARSRNELKKRKNTLELVDW